MIERDKVILKKTKEILMSNVYASDEYGKNMLQNNSSARCKMKLK